MTCWPGWFSATPTSSPCVADDSKGRRDRSAHCRRPLTRITRRRWLSRVLTVAITGHESATMKLTWTVDTTARRAMETELFGKRLLVTDRENWPVVEVIAGYYSQSDAEAGCRQLQDPKVISFSPMWALDRRPHPGPRLLPRHRTGRTPLMRRQSTQAGIPMSVRELLDHLAGIQETVLLYPSTGGRPRDHRMITEMTPTQQRLFDLFGLDRYTPPDDPDM